MSACLALGLAGCVTSIGHVFPEPTTELVLGGSNYKLLKAHASGESSGYLILGFLPITAATYNEAKTNLDQSLNQTLEGPSIALTNRCVHHSTRNWILYTRETITLTADVIEFK